MYFCGLVMVCVRRSVSVREMNAPAYLAEGIKEVRSPGRTIRRRAEDSASSRTKLFIDDGYMFFYPLSFIPHSGCCRTYHPAPLTPSPPYPDMSG